VGGPNSQVDVNQIQDGGRPPFQKIKNRHFTATVQTIAMKFGIVTLRQMLVRIFKVLISRNPRWLTVVILKI